jgi:CAAX prenyl protease-like protein
VLLGAAAFGIWMALDLLFGSQSNNRTLAGLAALPEWARVAWVTGRVAAALITVPIAEELAFRGFLIPQLVPANLFGARTSTFIAVVISSVAFGVMHGSHWIPGTLAGMIYAAAFCQRGRIGDAVVAHATTNALLMVWVLWTGNWSAW